MRARVLLLVTFLTVSVVAQDRGPFDLVTAAVPEGAVKHSYGNDPLQFGELRVPKTKGPHPVAIVIHGGCWLAKLGTMDPRAVAIDNMRPLANLDLKRVISIGHSAGGHFALWLAARHRIAKNSELYSANPLPLAGVVDLDGPGDLQATLPLQQPICGSPVITNLIGGTPQQHPDRYRAASPIELLPLGSRQVFLAGRMFGPQASGYEAAAKKAGDSIQVSVSDSGHFVFIDPASSMWPTVLKSVRSMLPAQ